MSCGACRGVMLGVLAAIVSCRWRCFLVNSSWGGGGEAVLCLRTALPWITPFYYYYYESKSLFLCMHAWILLHNPSQPFSGSPMTSFKLLSANILILTSLHPLLGFLSSCSVYFPLTVSRSSPWFLGSAGMSPQLKSTNQFSSESVTSYFICSLPISSAPPPIFTQFDINLMCFIFPCIPSPLSCLADASSVNCTFKSSESHTQFNTHSLFLGFHFGKAWCPDIR